MGKKGTTSGLIALGLAAFAYWKYKMTPEQKQNVKDKISDLTSTIKNKASNVASQVKKEVNTQTNS